MRKSSYTGAFFLCLLINIALNFRLTIPGWILLVLHFIFSVSIWWFIGYMGAFLLYMIIWQLIWHIIGRVGASAKDLPEPKNINPYSVKSNEVPLRNGTPAENNTTK